MKKIIAGSLIASSLLWGSNSIELNINNNTLELGADYSLNSSYMLNDDSNYFLTVKYLGSEEENSNKSTQRLLSVGLKVINPYIDDHGFSLGLGMKTVVADNYSSESFIATPLELFATYNVNEQLSIETQVGYAPKILTFLDGNTYKDAMLKVNYRIIDNGYVYVGGRKIKTEYEDIGTIEYDDSVFFGYKITF